MAAIPPKLRAGDSWTWTDSFSDYPASAGWVVTYYFQGPNGFSIASTASGDEHALAMAASATAAIPAGELAWFARATKTTSSYTVAMGSVEILPNYVAGLPFEQRTTAKQMLDAVDACLLSLLSRTSATVSFGDRSYTIQDIEKLRAIRADLRAEVASESGKNNGKTIKIKFS